LTGGSPFPILRPMQRDRDLASGLLLAGSALAMTVVMVLHPTGHARGMLNRVVHGLALAATPALFLGMLGVQQRLAPSRLATAAVVAWGFGSIAVAGAALASGFVTPGVLAQQLPRELLAYTFLWNQACAAVNVVAWGIAILLWSAAIARTGRLPVPLAGSGFLVAALVLLGFGSGHLRTDVHGFGIITFVQSAWLLWLGIVLCLGEGRT